MPADANLLRQVMRRFATGVMVLTVQRDQELHAVTVNAVASLSLNPVLMLVCLEKNGHSHELVRASGAFALNILGAQQRELGERFAYDREARSHPLDFTAGYSGETGALIFAESLGFLECRVVSECEGGDHTIFVGAVVNAQVRGEADDALLYFGGKFMNLRGE